MLDLTVREALTFFSSSPKVLRRLQVLDEIGLGYLRLGQPATTLSGGEAQRIKIAAHLSSHGGERLLYILDEPTTGLHFDDIAKLLTAFRKLLEAGHTLLVIEHNLDVIKTADYIIDLGPEGGEDGGMVVATGTPEQVAQVEASHTGRYLAASAGARAGRMPTPRLSGLPPAFRVTLSWLNPTLPRSVLRPADARCRRAICSARCWCTAGAASDERRHRRSRGLHRRETIRPATPRPGRPRATRRSTVRRVFLRLSELRHPLPGERGHRGRTDLRRRC